MPEPSPSRPEAVVDAAAVVAELQRRLKPEGRTSVERAEAPLDRRYLDRIPEIACADGLRMSVQTSYSHYCQPRDSMGPWWAVEVGFPSQRIEELMPYIDGENSEPTDTVYGYVPITLVGEIVAAHGGLLPTEEGSRTSSDTREGEPVAAQPTPANPTAYTSPPTPSGAATLDVEGLRGPCPKCADLGLYVDRDGRINCATCLTKRGPTLPALLSRAEEADRLELELADAKADYLRRHNEATDHFERAIEAEAKLAASEAQAEALREALKEAADMFAEMERSGTIPDPLVDEQVRALGEAHGFGAMMNAASRIWRVVLKADGYPAGGEFTVGPCRATVSHFLARARQALSSEAPNG